MGKIDEKTMNWQLNMLPRATKRALQFLSQQKWLKTSHWYLAGGTALALQVGHRQSVDLDFFTQDKEFSINELLKHFPEKIWTSDIVREGTIYGRLLGAKVSFIAYPFFYSQDESLRYGTINVLSARDIAVMKIIAISQRGKKRDFIDLYWYAKNRESLTDIVKRLPKQYPTVAHDYHHIWKSLMYFKDAEDDPMPKVSFNVQWDGVRSFFIREVPKMMKGFLMLQ